MLSFSEYISFQNFNWWWLMIGLMVWVITLYLTYMYKPKYIILKAVIWLLAISSLCFIINQPKIKTSIKVKKAVLLTTKNAVKKFEETKIDQENTFILSSLNFDTKLSEVVNLDHLLHLKKQVTEIEIVGNGLTIKALQNLPAVPIKFILLENDQIELKSFEVNYPLTVFVGEMFTMDVSLTGDTITQFYKTDYNEDTLKRENDKISWNHQLSVAGKHLIKINLYNQAKTVVDIIAMPIEVIEKTTANILMLNGYPFFEHQHLKEFIGKQNHQLLVRTVTSNNKYRYDFINTKEEKAFGINKQFLKEIDLLIIDGAALKSLSKEEYDAINRQWKNGMGILLRVDDQYEFSPNSWEELKLGIKRTANSERDFVTVNKDGKPIEIEVFPFNNKLPKTNVFIGEGTGKILSTNQNRYQPFSITNIKNSYLFNLRGDSIIYNWLWKNIIDVSFPQKLEIKNIWRLKNNLANVEDDYIEVELITNEPEPAAYVKTPGDNSDWIRLSLKQSYINNELYETTFWPKQSGWHYFKTALDTVIQQIYVPASNENILLRNNFKNRFKFQLMEQQNKTTNRQTTQKGIETEKPIPLFWNWLVFVICLSLILIIEKFL